MKRDEPAQHCAVPIHADGPDAGARAMPRDGWCYEEKVDGWRMLACKDGARVRLISRNGRDHTRRFADIAAAVAKLSPPSLVLDGEVAIYDTKLRSRSNTQPLSTAKSLRNLSGTSPIPILWRSR